MTNLHVILRTCLKSQLDTIIKHDDPMGTAQRVCGPNRELMVIKCITSLIDTINNADWSIKLTILDDQSSPEFLHKLQLLTNACNKQHEIIKLEQQGYNNSAHQQFLFCANSNDLVYSVEDDYLHEPRAIEHMMIAYNHFYRMTNKPTLLYPMDDTFRYDQQKGIEKTKLYYDGYRYWRTITKTTNTFFTHQSVIESNFETFKELALEYPDKLEDDTINKLYYSEDTECGVIHAYSPLPSVAYHLSYTPHVSIQTPHLQWSTIWNSIHPWTLIDGWFDYEQFYSLITDRLPHNAKIVEVGCWMGKSTACLATLCKAKDRNITVYAVDTWQGSNETLHDSMLKKLANANTSLRDVFDQNMQMCDVSKDIVPLQMLSSAASKLFENNSLDFIMLDASHTYNDVKDDINNWLPKIKKGGIISGDDYCQSWPGVIAAVDEIFSNSTQIMGKTWFKVV